MYAAFDNEHPRVPITRLSPPKDENYARQISQRGIFSTLKFCKSSFQNAISLQLFTKELSSGIYAKASLRWKFNFNFADELNAQQTKINFSLSAFYSQFWRIAISSRALFFSSSQHDRNFLHESVSPSKLRNFVLGKPIKINYWNRTLLWREKKNIDMLISGTRKRDNFNKEIRPYAVKRSIGLLQTFPPRYLISQ